jgi:hypothetical protein
VTLLAREAALLDDLAAARAEVARLVAVIDQTDRDHGVERLKAEAHVEEQVALRIAAWLEENGPNMRHGGVTLAEQLAAKIRGGDWRATKAGR